MRTLKSLKLRNLFGMPGHNLFSAQPPPSLLDQIRLAKGEWEAAQTRLMWADPEVYLTVCAEVDAARGHYVALLSEAKKKGVRGCA